MRAGAGCQARSAARQHEAPLEHVDGQGEHDRRGHEGDCPAVHETPQRQHEHEEAQVVAEQGIDAAERRRVQVAQHQLPVDGGSHPGGQRDQQQDDREEPANQRLDDHAARQSELVLELPDHVRRRRASRERQVGVEEDEHADREHGEERPAQRERLDEDFRVSDLDEPEPIGIERNHLGEKTEDQEQEEQQQDRLRPVHRPRRAPIRCRGSRRRGIRAGRS